MYPSSLSNVCPKLEPTDKIAGASNGRGPRCSGWFADYIADQQDKELLSLTLSGGIKGWVKSGETYTEQMNGYEPEHWRQFE